MIRYKIIINGSESQVFLNVKNPNEKALINYEGEGVEDFRRFLKRQYGAFGHIIGEATTPIDLHYAMSSPQAQIYFPNIEEGEDLIAQYDPDIPENAVT